MFSEEIPTQENFLVNFKAQNEIIQEFLKSKSSREKTNEETTLKFKRNGAEKVYETLKKFSNKDSHDKLKSILISSSDEAVNMYKETDKIILENPMSDSSKITTPVVGEFFKHLINGNLIESTPADVIRFVKTFFKLKKSELTGVDRYVYGDDNINPDNPLIVFYKKA
jgi:hypothetical protein